MNAWRGSLRRCNSGICDSAQPYVPAKSLRTADGLIRNAAAAADGASALCRKETSILKQLPRSLSRIRSGPDVGASDFSEQVRDLFNDRAQVWGRNYQPQGKLAWRLDEFYSVLGEVASPPAEVLDFGCGTGHLAERLRKGHYQLTACDMADQMIVTARHEFGEANIKWVSLPADWRRLPFADQSYDAVMASCVLEYVDDLKLVFGEMARVLRIGGVLIFNVPNPKNGRRQREMWAKRIARPKWIRRAVCVVPRIQRYLNYLGLSKNRLALEEWEIEASGFGFQRLQQPRQQNAGRPLFLFVFRRGTSTTPSRRDTVEYTRVRGMNRGAKPSKLTENVPG
jgi:ubiquinone/menaquinone biosynthesis C-methylase UbiE